MMREDEIDAAGVNVKRFAEIFHGHRRALDVPARTTAANLSVPRRLIGTARLFPECEVARVLLLVAISVNPFTATHDVAGKVNLRKLAVFRKRADAIVDRAVRTVGVIVLQKSFD